MRGGAGFFGWRVVWAAFTVAVFGWGLGFYAPPILLQAIHEARGWPVSTVSVAVTLHFLLGAFVVARLPALHARFGRRAVTRFGGVASGGGLLLWVLAQEPWQLFAATPVSGAGWAMTGAAAINAFVSPWFVRGRPAALSTAYNGASLGGVLVSPLLVALVAGVGAAGAVAVLGAAMAGVLWVLAGRVLGRDPASMGQVPDGGAAGLAAGVAAEAPARPAAPLGRPWRDRRFATLAALVALGLVAQIGLLAHLFSLLVPILGAQGAGLAMGMATACAVAGRSLAARLLQAGAGGADRRLAAAGSYGVQALGAVVLLLGQGDAAAMLAGLALFGLGIGNATSLPPLIAQAEFAPAETGRAVALVTATGQGFYAFAPAGFGLLREAGGGTALFLAAAVLQGAAIAVALAGRRRGAARRADVPGGRG